MITVKEDTGEYEEDETKNHTYAATAYISDSSVGI